MVNAGGIHSWINNSSAWCSRRNWSQQQIQKNGQQHLQYFQKIVEGQLFFNSTANAFKETLTDIPGGTWASGGSLNTARGVYQAGGGNTNTAGISFWWRKKVLHSTTAI